MLAALAIINIVVAGFLINDTIDQPQVAAQEPTSIVASIDTTTKTAE